MALENLNKIIGIDADWNERATLTNDGVLNSTYDGQAFSFNTAVKKEIQQHQVEKLLIQAKNNAPFALYLG